MRTVLGRLIPVLSLPLVLAACSAQPGSEVDTDSAAASTASFSHVHGLALNPADGGVYAATHHGLYLLEDNAATLVGSARPDLMGFTAVGPDTFLASGHPAVDEEGPANLGLLRSSDGGHSWSEVSLGGESDFHALTAVDERIYGLDSSTGTVKRSGDGGDTWQEGAAVAARDIDVDPGEPDRLVATTADGLMVSEDGGATFQRSQNQPPRPLVVIDHLPSADSTGPSILTGLDASGVLWSSPGHGWSSVGPQNGAPAAFTAVDDQTYLAAFDTDVYRSDDGGRTWEQLLTGTD